jgi:hypothetical protein
MLLATWSMGVFVPEICLRWLQPFLLMTGVDRVVLGQDFLPVLSFSPASIIHLCSILFSFICHRRCIILAIDGIVQSSTSDVSRGWLSVHKHICVDAAVANLSATVQIPQKKHFVVASSEISTFYFGYFLIYHFRKKPHFYRHFNEINRLSV